MKKKRIFSKILVTVLVLSLMFTALPSFSASAQETMTKEQLTKKSELWQPETNQNALNFKGDLSLDELKTAKLAAKDTPEIVSAETIKKKGHVNRLWEQEEDLNTIIFQNQDGTKTAYKFNESVKYKDKNGKIKDKSNKISKTSDGDFTNAENDINTYFPKKLNRNKGVELKFDEYVVEMAPDIKGNSGASRQTGHNKYYDSTEYVQYPNVFDEGISLRYTPTFEGYKEDIVLNKYTGVNEFSFRLYTDGLSLVMSDEGSYCLTDPLTGEFKTQIGDLVVYDSRPFDVPDKILNESVSNPTKEDYAKKEAFLKEAEKNIAKESPNSIKTYSHQYKVETVKADNEYRITVVVDEDYLTDSERVYPVYVDPTIEVSGSGTSKTIQDAPIYSDRPSTAHGNNEYNVVGGDITWEGVNFGIGRTLMKFPGLASDSTYKKLATDQITSLELHIYEGSESTNNSCIDLWQYNGASWTESTARCGNIGWYSYFNNFTWNYINCSGWQTFDLTSMVDTWKSGGTGVGSPLDKGIMLKNYTSESSSDYSKHFMSTESSYKPYLTFTYYPMPTGVELSQTSATIDVGDAFNLYANVLPSNTSQAVTWSSSDPNVATVSSGGLVCARASGTTIVKARSTINSNIFATCIVTVNVVLEDGEYYLKNTEYDKYVQIDNNASYQEVNSIFELWDFDGENVQKFRFEHINYGYYKISCVASNYAITAPSNVNESVTQSPYTGSNSQLWYITISDNKYILSPKSNPTYYMSAGDGIFTSNGRNVEMRTYQSDGKDDWIICTYDTSILLAIEDDDGEKRDRYFAVAKSNLQTENNRRISVTETVKFSSKTVSSMLNYLQSYEIFIIHTHGQQDGFKISNSGTEFITMSNISNHDLSNLSFALLMTCNTGIGYSEQNITNNTPVNIVEQMVICGAETVVGFSDETYVDDCNKLGEDITFKLINERLSIIQSINTINYDSYYEDMSSIAVVAGNINNRIR